MMNSIAASKLRLWREEPIRFLVDELHIEPDAWQADVLRDFPRQDANEKRVSLQACAGPGKSLTLAACGLNFLTCYGEPGEHPKGAVVSITQDNLKTNIWPEFSKLMQRSKFLSAAFKWTKERIYAVDHPETWFLSARSFSRDANAEEQGRTLSGLHAKRVLFLLDESGEIPVAVSRAAEQALSNCAWGKIMQAGNPTSHEGMLYAAATKLRHLWKVVSITGDPLDPKRSTRVDKAWAEEQIKTNGREDPWVMAYILGQFPDNAINSLLSLHEVEQAMARSVPIGTIQYAQKRLGIDVARGGLDKTSLFPRQGLQAYKPVHMSHARGNDVAARAAQAREKWGWEQCFVDDTGGYGGSVCDSFIQAGVPHLAVNFSSSAIDSRYFNKRSEMWFNMAKWVKRGGCLPDLPNLRKELTCPTYSFHNGKFRLEEKDQIKKRLGFSPDDADALALTFALPEMPSMNGIDVPQNGLKSEFDPHAQARVPERDALERHLMESMR